MVRIFLFAKRLDRTSVTKVMASAGDDSRFIVSGGPVPQNVTEGHGSLGSYLRNRMQRNGNDVGLVSTALHTHLVM